MFNAGNKVVCIDAQPGRRSGIPLGLRLGEIYTVTYAFIEPNYNEPGCYLAELEAPSCHNGFWQKRFAIVEEKSETSFEQIMQSIGAVASISKEKQMSN